MSNMSCAHDGTNSMYQRVLRVLLAHSPPQGPKDGTPKNAAGAQTYRKQFKINTL